jgi:hypothetical protein
MIRILYKSTGKEGLNFCPIQEGAFLPLQNREVLQTTTKTTTLISTPDFMRVQIIMQKTFILTDTEEEKSLIRAVQLTLNPQYNTQKLLIAKRNRKKTPKWSQIPKCMNNFS